MSRNTLRATVTGMIAGAVSALALMLCGRAEGTTAAGPLNGPSQWLWGEKAARSRRWSWRTLAGIAIHQWSAVGWGFLHVFAISRTPEQQSAASLVTRAMATAALAATVDYGVTPRRLEPGFDKQLSLASLVVVYAAFGAGLALSDLLFASRAPSRPRRRRGT